MSSRSQDMDTAVSVDLGSVAKVHRSTNKSLDCRCGQALDCTREAHCPRCGRTLALERSP